MGKRIRIGVGYFMHETVTFLSNDTTRDDFIYEGSPLAGEALLQSFPNSYMGGFVKVAREFDNVELIGVTSPMFPKTYTSSGWITEDAYESFASMMSKEFASVGPFDGVFLSLHGAMAVRGVDRPEADLARRIRDAVGDRPFVVATFDPHGNEDAEFFGSADFAFCAKYYPHYDDYLQGTRAARALVRAIRGDYRPAQATCKVPILTPTVLQWTGAAPWSELVQRALIWEARHPDLYVNVFFGFPWSDVVDAGLTVQAISNDDPTLAGRAVTDIASFAWRVREGLANAASVYSIGEGVERAIALARERGRVVLADHSDRSGRATWLLAQLIAQDAGGVLVATVADPTLAERLREQGLQPGDPFDLEVGGGSEPSDGSPVRVTGRLAAIVDTDLPANTPWIVVHFGRENVLVVTPSLTQIYEPSPLPDLLGIDPDDFRIIALKSRVHFRLGFVDGGFAENVVLVEPESPFLGTTRLDALPYEHLAISDYYPYGRHEFQPVAVRSGGQRTAHVEG